MAEQESAAPDPAPAKKSKKGLMIIIAVCLVAVGGGGMLVMKFRGASAQASNEKADTGKESGATSKTKSLLTLEPFLVNLADMEAPRFLKVTFKLGLDEESLGEKYGEDPVILSAVRDKILSLLSVKSADEILTPAGKDKLRTEIKEKLNPIFPKGKIVEVFILDFVVQL
jgi:flagellar protein FliL